MSELLHELIIQRANTRPAAPAVTYKDSSLSYADLSAEITSAAQSLIGLGLAKNERIAIYLPKRLETVVSFFATSLAGGVFVPINPLLKPTQVAYILQDCNVRILITSQDRYNALKDALTGCHDMHTVVLLDNKHDTAENVGHFQTLGWSAMLANGGSDTLPHRRIDTDIAAILYTSGSTGNPKGVVLSHRNMVAGAKSVAQYLENHEHDRLLAVLPFSFDYGLSQLTTSFVSGACTVLMDYLFPRDVIKMVAKEGITGLAAVPPLWNQIAQLPWPEEATDKLRYITNSGGALPKATIASLQKALPTTNIYLMYGLTEAFRSTFLPPSEINKRPDSIGKAIPNAEVIVVREDGTQCASGEPGELVHKGSLVSMGYWNDPNKTNEHFKPAPNRDKGLPLQEIAVWSGDTVRMDEEGYLYFVSRKDDMIKTSGYRVSPTEVEEVIYSSNLVEQVAAIGVPHAVLGQAVVTILTPNAHSDKVDKETILAYCKSKLPAFMVPEHIVIRQNLPKNPNGKIDRKTLAKEYQDLFQEDNE